MTVDINIEENKVRKILLKHRAVFKNKILTLCGPVNIKDFVKLKRYIYFYELDIDDIIVKE